MRRRVPLIAAAALLLLVGMGAIYERAGKHRDRQRLPQVGRSIDIGGRAMNIFCSGEGSPAVVFDAGNGASGFRWSHIQPQIAPMTRACWFDRAGEGWSDAGPFPRTSAAMAADLHALLRRADVPAPYVLVGHSLGGLNARVYNDRYPTDVAGAVLVDAAHEDEPRRAPDFMRGRTAPRWLWRPIWLAGQTARVTGLMRLLSPEISLPEDRSRTREQIVEALGRQPKSAANHFDASIAESYAQAERSAGFGDKPLLVLTRGRMPEMPPHPTDRDRQSAEYEKVWMHEIQPKLARLSTRGRQVVVPHSRHGIPDEAPDAVVLAIRDVVGWVRAPVTAAAVLVYEQVLRSSFHGGPGWKMVVKSTPVPMRIARAFANTEWSRQFDGMPAELRHAASGDAPMPHGPFSATLFPPGTRLADDAAIAKLFDADGQPSPAAASGELRGWLAVSEIVWSADGRDALVYYEGRCGGLCGEGGYIWARHDGATREWRTARKIIAWMS